MRFRYVFLGLSLRSSRSNEDAATCRALLRALVERGHDVVYIEPRTSGETEDDLAEVPRTDGYASLEDLVEAHDSVVRAADIVIVGSRLPNGIAVAQWVLDRCPLRVAFYDLDTPGTLRALEGGECAYLSAELVSRLPLYLSLANGPTLDVLRRHYDAPWVRPLLPCIDPSTHFPEPLRPSWDVGHLAVGEPQGDAVDLLVEVARRHERGRFVVAGSRREDEEAGDGWPANLERHAHVPVAEHRHFYGAQRFTLALGRTAKPTPWWSPSPRLFEAAACATPIITEPCSGLEELFQPGVEILVARTAADVVRLVRELPDAERLAVADAGRRRVLAEHTSQARAETLERYTRELLERRLRRSRPSWTTAKEGGGGV